MQTLETNALKGRLDAYRALLRRDGPVPELERLVDLLEAELRGGNSGEPAHHRSR